jgi:hypothetical protein
MSSQIVAKHTPAPWLISDGREWTTAITSSSGAVCRVISDTPANDAHLIAAAPDLLASLREFVELYAGTRDMLGASVTAKLARAEAALAKADGVQ